MADQAISDYIGVGVVASRPNPPDPPSGGSAFYYATDQDTLYVWDSTAWLPVAKDVIAIAVSDETTALTTGTAKVTFRMPYAFRVLAVRASVTTAPTDANIVVDINESGVSILSTELEIDATEKTSTTAATAAVISDAAIADDAEMTIDIDQVGSTIPGAGLKVYIIGVPV